MRIYGLTVKSTRLVDAIDFVSILSLVISFKVARDLEDPMRLQFEPQFKNNIITDSSSETRHKFYC